MSPEEAAPCARYFGSDLTLCATHNVPFASPSETRCGHIDALRTPAEPGLREAVEAAAKIGCIRQFWGARRPCAEYDDGRELCAPCLARAALAATPDTLDARTDEPCVHCHGTRWADDENWTPDDPKTWRGERSPGDGLIPCGGCNFGGWDTPLAARLREDRP